MRTPSRALVALSPTARRRLNFTPPSVSSVGSSIRSVDFPPESLTTMTPRSFRNVSAFPSPYRNFTSPQ